MRIWLAAAVATTLSLPALPALAGPARAERREERREERAEKAAFRDPGINHQQRRQASRLVRGVRSGQLTAAEARALADRERDLGAMERAMKADGTLDAGERAALRGAMDGLSHDIFEEKHDGATAHWQTRLALDTATHAQAKAYLIKAHRVVVLRGLLNVTVADAERARLQAEHDALLDELYEEQLAD